jgi:BirA family transcriptional regulator, biotin operon repressor / biotin---[acetyl-CoA-carboxylase] ligase
MIKKLNANLVNIVDILNDGQYHDGSTMGDRLNMTRSAVWKTIRKLEAYDIKIDSIKGKGYALLEPLILLDQKKIKKKLCTEKIDISIFECIDSTNDYLKLKTFPHNQSIKICLAEQQTRGKGRFNREWYSPFGQNIYLSCIYPFRKDISELAGLSLVASLAIVKTLQTYGLSDHLYAKWPNDVVYQNKKLSGCLIEIQAESHGASHAIIGVGINVNMLNDDHHIQQTWTSMRKILAQYIDRNELCARLITHFLDHLQQFAARGFTPFAEEWMQADSLMNKIITLKNFDEKITGKVMGINDKGHLLLRLENGTVRSFSSGDTSIVKKS